MLRSKRPRFKLDFTINELTNIPHTSGYCYLEMTISDGSPLSGIMATFSHLKRFSGHSSESPASNEVLPVGSASSASGPVSNSSSSAHSPRSIFLKTSNYKIHNFKVHFNVEVSCNLRFPVKRKDNMVGDKILTLRVFYESEKGSKFKIPTQLGVVKLNLAEYLNFNDLVSAKYLLQDSKINSIISLSTQLSELSGDSPFTTDLRIVDSKITPSNGSIALHPRSPTVETKEKRGFNVPQFLRKSFLGGIDGVMSSSQKSATLDGADSDTLKNNPSKNLPVPKTPTEPKIDVIGSLTCDNIVIDPVIGTLYRKTLESNWDKDLHVMLKLLAERVIEDIFLPNDYSERSAKNLAFYHNLNNLDDSDVYQDMNGLLQETQVREELKSWTVTTET